MPVPEPGEDETEDEFIGRCVSFLMKEDPDRDQDQAVAICYSQWRKEAYRSPDFERIYGEFIKYHCKSKVPCNEGVFEYQAWIKDLGLDETKPYARSLEAYRWAADMITKLKEDTENTYWRVPFAFPIKSMNNNVYTEDEIKNAVKSIVGKSPNLNHWQDTREEFKAGGVVITAAEYEDGAGESILKVPNNFVCPMCGEGKTLNSLIAAKKIVNVSLETGCSSVDDGVCVGMEFDGYALLTADTLPGIPLARIKPLEAIMREALGNKKEKPKMSITVTGLGKKKEATPSAGDPNKPVPEPTQLPDGNFQCPDGYFYSAEQGKCVSTDCPEGQVWDDSLGKCRPIEEPSPEGTGVSMGTPAAADTSKAKVGEDMNNAEIALQLSEAELRAFKAEQKAMSFEEQVKHLEKMNAEKIMKLTEFAAEIKSLRNNIEKLDATVDKRNKDILDLEREIVRKDVEIESKTKEYRKGLDAADKRNDDTSASRDSYKAKLEELKTSYDALNDSYQKMINTNLDLTQRLTKANEDYLSASKDRDSLADQLKKAKRLGKVIVSMKPSEE